MNKFETYKKWVNEKFTLDSDPIKDLGIGIKSKIIKWLEDAFIDKYKLNDDLSIDVYEHITIFNRNLDKEKHELPIFINFNHAYNDFAIANIGLKSLRGCPKIVDGNFYCSWNSLDSYEGCPEIIKKIFYGQANNIIIEIKPYPFFPKFIGGNCRLMAIGEGKVSTKKIKYVKSICQVKGIID